MYRNIIIIGAGNAGLSAAKAARAQDSEARIDVFSKEFKLPYYRLRLCEFVGSDINYDKLYINPFEWYERNNIHLHLNTVIESIDPVAKVINTAAGSFGFDSLVVASGSTPFMPPFAGKELKNIHTLWTCEDVEDINKGLIGTKNAVVIGGGLLGLETAYMISKKGIAVTLIEGLPRLLPKQLDAEGSAVFGEKVKSHGIEVICGVGVNGFAGDSDKRVTSVIMADGRVLDADIVVVSVGVSPNTAICRNSGLNIDRFIAIDEKMQTNYDSIYAAGDVASYMGKWLGQWAVAGGQGQVAGTNAAGGDVTYHLSNTPYNLTTMGTRVVCSGDTGLQIAQDSTDSFEFIRTVDSVNHGYSNLVFKNGVFSGYMLVGDSSKAFNSLQPMLGVETDKEAVGAKLPSSHP